MYMQRKSPLGFTLIELLVVVAIISILSAIAVPNFLEAQTRAKVSRVKADQRSLATVLESYMVDNNNKYPIRRQNWKNATKPDDIRDYCPPFNAKLYDPAEPYAAVGMHVLTTPIKYMSSLPSDIFNRPALLYAAPGTPYTDGIDYWDPWQTDKFVSAVGNPTGTFQEGCGRGWVLISVGPDQALGVSKMGIPGNYPHESILTQQTLMYIYDPTNGSVSTGNVYRFSGNLTQADLRKI